MEITGAHERLQPVDVGATEDWRDEVELVVWDPGSSLVLVARLAVQPNRPGATAGALAWIAGRPAYVYGHAVDDAPLADWDDLTIAAARLRELEPLTTWALDLDDGDNGLSLRWDGRSAALATGDSRYEQAAHVRGRAVLNGHAIDVDGVGFRTHTWGEPPTVAAHRYLGFLGPADAAVPDERCFTVHLDHAPTGFVSEGGADHLVTDATADGDHLTLTTDAGRVVRLTTSAHGEAVGAGTGRLQLLRFSADDGLEGYGLAERF